MNRPLTPDQLASRWMCSAETIRSLCASGKLRAKKPSPRVIEYLSASGALEFGGPRLVKENGNG